MSSLLRVAALKERFSIESSPLMIPTDDLAPEGSSDSPVLAADPAEAPEPGSLGFFSSEQLPAALRTALANKGFHQLTKVQQGVLEAETELADLRISSQTGSGKTVAVGLAIGRFLIQTGERRGRVPEEHQRSPEVLLLTPTRELASQVKRELQWLFAEVPDAWVEVVTGGTSVGLERKSLSKGPRIVVATPGRALDHFERGALVGDRVAHVVLDEADQMFDLGFREELSAILEKLPGERRTHLVSATFSGDVKRIAERHQSHPVFVEGTALGRANDDIEHVAHVVGLRHRYDALVNLLLKHRAMGDDDEPGRALIFTRTRADALEVAERLQRDNLPAEPLSGDLAQAARTRTLAGFRSGRVRTLVATDVAARGIDVAGIELVVHFDPPENPDAFTHRSGRTGRAGQKGISVMFLPPQARGRLERLFKVAGVKPSWAPIPTADKIRRLYSKLGRRRIYQALETRVDEEHLEYAKKLCSEHPPEEVIARLLAMAEVPPPCLPRELSEHIAAEGHGHRRKADARGRFEGRKREGRRPWSERGEGRGGADEPGPWRPRHSTEGASSDPSGGDRGPRPGTVGRGPGGAKARGKAPWPVAKKGGKRFR